MDNLTDAQPPSSNTLDNMRKNMKEGTITAILFGAIAVLIIWGIFFFYKQSTLQKTSCDSFNQLYGTINGKLKSINGDQNFKHLFRDYYIKTAYNCCSTGDYKHGTVSTCALRDLIRQGVRGLDFEIYSIKNEPVVSTSTVNKNTVKETYDSVPFKDALGVIINYAFTNGSCPNPDDPIVIHIRFKSTNHKMYEKLADILKENTAHTLSPKYSYENGGRNLGEAPLQDLKKKIIIIVNNVNRTYADVKTFYEYVNMTSGSIFMRMFTADQLRNIPNMQELVTYNKRHMTICLPDATINPPNPSGVAARKMGIQMIAMRFQNQDVVFQEQDAFFDANNSAFVLKPAPLRFIQKYIPAPTKQDPKLSFAKREMREDSYHFDI